MSRIAAPLALLAAALASACAHVAAPKPVDLTQQCVTDLRQLPVTRVGVLSAAAEKKLRPQDYSQIARCMESADGSKFAVALFQLDDVRVPANLRVVMSEARGGVLAAAITTLDENYAAIDRTGFDRFVNRGTTNTADVLINNAAVRYFLISPDTAEVGKSEKQFRTQINSHAVPLGPGAIFVLTTSNATQDKRMYSDAGMLTVTVRPAGPVPVSPQK